MAKPSPSSSLTTTRNFLCRCGVFPASFVSLTLFYCCRSSRLGQRRAVKLPEIHTKSHFNCRARSPPLESLIKDARPEDNDRKIIISKFIDCAYFPRWAFDLRRQFRVCNTPCTFSQARPELFPPFRFSVRSTIYHYYLCPVTCRQPDMDTVSPPPSPPPPFKRVTRLLQAVVPRSISWFIFFKVGVVRKRNQKQSPFWYTLSS